MFKDFKIKIFADGADLKSVKSLNKEEFIKGFTTNPSLMKKAGVTDYKSFSIELINLIGEKPISLEVFTDDIKEMEKQAKVISSWGKNVYVKIPITNTKGESTVELVKTLLNLGVKCNVTAVFTLKQVKEIFENSNNKTNLIISIFSGRIADTGRNPVQTIKDAIELCQSKKNIEILWASTRELFNIVEAEKCRCHIITVPYEILSKFKNIGKDLNLVSTDTVKSFYQDALSAGFKIKT